MILFSSTPFPRHTSVKGNEMITVFPVVKCFFRFCVCVRLFGLICSTVECAISLRHFWVLNYCAIPLFFFFPFSRCSALWNYLIFSIIFSPVINIWLVWEIQIISWQKKKICAYFWRFLLSPIGTLLFLKIIYIFIVLWQIIFSIV